MSRVSCDTHSWPPMILRFLPPSITAHCSTTPTWSAACHVSGPRAISHLPLAYTQALHPSCSSRVTGSLLCHGSSRTWASRKLHLFSIATTVLTLLPWEYLLLSQIHSTVLTGNVGDCWRVFVASRLFLHSPWRISSGWWWQAGGLFLLHWPLVSSCVLRNLKFEPDSLCVTNCLAPIIPKSAPFTTGLHQKTRTDTARS